MSIPIGGWLVSKKLQYAEEASFGVPAASPSYSQIGYDAPVYIDAPTGLTALPTPGSEDPLVLAERTIDLYNLTVNYRPFDTVFAKYGVNAQGGGSGSIDKSFNMLLSVALGGSGETFILPVGCRIDNFRMGGRAGGPVQFRAKIASQLVPIPSTTVPSGTFPANPSTVPFLFSQGGPQPISIGGTPYNVNRIEVNVERNIDRIPSPGSQIAQDLKPTARTITGTVGIVWKDTSNYTRLANDQSFTLAWTFKTGGSTLTLSGCRFRALETLNLEPDRTVYETYSLEALSGTLT